MQLDVGNEHHLAPAKTLSFLSVKQMHNQFIILLNRDKKVYFAT